MNPLVSVIIPTYKRSEMLLDAINSVLAQSYKYIEVIVVDDNNPNTEYRRCTEERMARYSNNKRVIYIKHEKNKNGAAARNTGLKASSGKYICFLDDDDCFFEEKCAKQVSFLENNSDYSSCCCDYKKNGVDVILPPKDDYSEDILLLKKTPQTSGIMFRKDVVQKMGGFNDSYIRHQDYEFLLRFFRDNNKIHKLDEVLYERKIPQNSNEPKGDTFLEVKRKFLSDFDDVIRRVDSQKKGFKRKVYSTHCEKLCKNYLKSQSFGSFLRFAIKSFCLNPIVFFRLFSRDFIHFIHS